MKKKRQPGQPCCDGCPCLIAKDSLAGDPLSGMWTLKTGSWDGVAVVDEYAQSTDVVELWHVTPHPDDPFPADVRLRVRGETGAVLRIILSASGDVATGDALIVELTPGTDCGTLKLYQRLDGVEDLLATQSVYGAVVDEWHDMRACYDPDTELFTGAILPHGQTNWRQIASEIENHTDGEYAGFASWTTDQSDFDTFVFRRLWYDKLITPTCPELSIAETLKGHGFVAGVQPTWTIPFGSNAWNWGTTTLLNVRVGTTNLSVLSTSYPTLQDMVDRFNVLCGPPHNRHVTFSYSGGWPTPEVVTVTGDGDDGFSLEEGYVSEAVFEWGEPMVNSEALSIQYESGTEESPAQNEIQTVTVTHAGGEGCQVFALSFDGEQTASISTSADAATVQAALEDLSTIGSGNVSVTGSAGGPWAVEFTGTLAETDVPMLTVNNTVCGTCLDYYYYYEPETERITCSGCVVCCLMSPPYHDGCDATVLSGEWANETMSWDHTMWDPHNLYCANRRNYFFRSAGAGQFRVESALVDSMPWKVRAHFYAVSVDDSPINYRLDLSNGDYITVNLDWSSLSVTLNGTDTFTTNNPVEWDRHPHLILEICRISATVYTITAGVPGLTSSDTHVETGGTVTGITSSWDDVRVSATVYRQTSVNITAMHVREGCDSCAACACRPKVKRTLSLDFGDMEFENGSGDCRSSDTGECPDLPGVVYLSAGTDECLWTGIIDPWLVFDSDTIRMCTWTKEPERDLGISLYFLVRLEIDPLTGKVRFSAGVTGYCYDSKQDDPGYINCSCTFWYILDEDCGFTPVPFQVASLIPGISGYYLSEWIDCEDLEDEITLTIDPDGIEPGTPGHPDYAEFVDSRLCLGDLPETITLRL